MRIYEEQNPFQAQTGGGGFNPVQEPDVAGAMERELRQVNDVISCTMIVWHRMTDSV